MGVTININMDRGISPAGDQKDFQNKIKDKTPEQLGEMMGDKNTPAWQKQELMNELMKDLSALQKQKGDKIPPEQKDAIKDFLDSFKKADAEEKKGGDILALLLQALGVPEEVAEKLGDALSEANQEDTEIQD